MTLIRNLTTRISICLQLSIVTFLFGGVLAAQETRLEIKPLPEFNPLRQPAQDKVVIANPFADAFQKAYGNQPSPQNQPRKKADLKTVTKPTTPTDSSPVPGSIVAPSAIQQSAVDGQNRLANRITELPQPKNPGRAAVQSTQFQSSVEPTTNITLANESVPSVPAQPNQLEPVEGTLVTGPIPSLSSEPTPSQFQIEGAMGQQLIWWRSQVQHPIYQAERNQPVDTNSLVYDAIKRSPRIRAISQDPLIREMQVVEADAEFDVTTFLDSQFQDRVDPVGDNLSTTDDGSPFLQDHIWSSNAGIRKKTRTGGTYEIGQQLGFRNSNSSFFNPQDQGTATLALNVTQPLLRGRGNYYNQSQILIAQAAGQVAWNSFASELQDEMQKTVSAYWQLYYSRSVFLQKQRNVERGERVLGMLVGRSELDSLPSQIARARSAVQSRKTDLANAYRDIRDAETEIRRLTADRNWQVSQSVEIVPVEPPVDQGAAMGLEQVVLTALKHRPEIDETMKRARIATVQRDVSVNELMPELSLLLGTYVSALRGESQVFEAFGDQFSGIKPGYSVGIEFEMPWRNRAAKSRLAQNKLRVAKITAEVDEVMQNVVAESQVSLRRVSSAQETMKAAVQAINAARFDLEQNIRRWESFALIEGDIADGQTPTTILDQLLGSQERLTSAELVFSKAELDLKTAHVDLQRTMGTLLIHQRVSFGRAGNDCSPTVMLNQASRQ